MNSLGKIYLIGMPGSGKSYFGKKLAEEVSLPLIDLDDFIENKVGLSIAEIFSKEGEEAFRSLEADSLKEVTSSENNMIISTGGGTPCFHGGIDYMNENGTTVYLETPLDQLIERNAQKDHRPLMKGDVAQRVHEIFEKRKLIYEQSHIAIAHRDVGMLLDLINSRN